MGNRFSLLALEAMKAGLEGKRLPNFGPITKEQIELVNCLYDEARNWHAGSNVSPKR